MSKPKRSASRRQKASGSKRSKLFHKVDAQAFRFGHLPGEIRNQIYSLLLVDPNPISIEVQQDYDCYDEIYDEVTEYGDADAVQLTSPTKHTIETGILFVNSTIYDEAVPILYGQNTFEFDGAYAWNDFCVFNWNLRNTNSRHLSKVIIGFPEIERLTLEGEIVSHFYASRDHGIEMLKRLENLDTLSFSVSEDIMARDIGLLKQIQDNCKKAYQRRLQSNQVEGDLRLGKMKNQDKDRGQAQDKGQYQIDLTFSDTEAMDADGILDNRTIRISTRAFESMQKWGWSIKGEYELIGRRHRFRNEEKWLQFLGEERDNGVRFRAPFGKKYISDTVYL